MPAVSQAVARGLSGAVREWESIVALAERDLAGTSSLVKRIFINATLSNNPGLIAASKEDPWVRSGKYGLGWVYFCVLLLTAAILMRLYHLWTDKVRTAFYKQEQISSSSSPDSSTSEPDFELGPLPTNSTVAKLFPREKPTAASPPKSQSSLSSISLVNRTIALVRYFFYRPVPALTYKKKSLTLPSLSVIFIVSSAFIFTTLYCFLPQPLYYPLITDGSPPLAIRSGMLAISLVPWIVAMSMKANLVSLITGIGHERLNVFHRWGGYLCLFLSLVHTIPFYIQPVWDNGGLTLFGPFLAASPVIYGTGIACLAPLIWLCVLSLPFIRHWMYELFVVLHVPVAFIFTAMLFWHSKNFLSSWSYLYATMAIWFISYTIRLFNLNWVNPWRLSWLIGEEAAVTLLSENAIKVTIPTQTKWRPGQYVYLRMPGISIFENHPFTIASLYSPDFPSTYGPEYHDMTLVFKPFGGFTRKVHNTALKKGPDATYRAYIDGPYGGTQRRLEAFDTVVLVAGGSGITAVVSQLLELIKLMRDGKAITRSIEVIWAVKRLESMEWFKEELRICRENAPPDSVHCQFFVTAAKRHSTVLTGDAHHHATRPISGIFGSEKIDHLAQGIASKRNSALIRDEAGGDAEKERELRAENEDRIAALPPRTPVQPPPTQQQQPAPFFPPPPQAHHPRGHQRQRPSLTLRTLPPNQPPAYNPGGPGEGLQPPQPSFDFGFPSTPTIFQKNLMRFAFGVSGVHKKKEGWSTEYGRPDIPYMLKEASKSFGKRTIVFVCGPPSMRTDVSSTVARLQQEVWGGGSEGREEIALHAENYAI